MGKTFCEKKYRRNGQSLIEVLVGIVLATIFIVGAATIILPSLQVGSSVQQVETSTNTANELLNNVESWSQGNWGGVTSLATGTSNLYYLNTATSPFTAVTAGEYGTFANGYAYRRMITFNNGGVSSTQTNFPVYIAGTYSYLAASSSGGLLQNPYGFDVIFTSDAAGLHKLNWENDDYFPISGLTYYWVNIPTLSPTTTIYMFYDNPAITSFQGNATGTWNSNFSGVWHLDSGGWGVSVATDSTKNANNGSWQGSPFGNNYYYSQQNPSPTAPVSADFDGSSDYITIPGSQPYLTYTKTAWINGRTINSYDNIISGNSYAFGVPGDVLAGGHNGNWNPVSPNITIPLNNGSWYFVNMTYDGSSIDLYANGNLISSVSSTAPNDDSNFLIGSYGGSNFYTGYMSEVEVSNIALSPSWIRTEYNNQSNSGGFSTIGPQVAGQPGELITVGTTTYARYFYLSDVYRNSYGLIAATGTTYYDPATKQITVVANVFGNTTSTQTVLSSILVHSLSNSWIQNDWSGGVGAGPFPYITNTYASAANINNSTVGAITLTMSSGTYANSGFLESPTYDTGNSTGTQFNSIVWQGTQGGAGLNFSFAVSNSSSGPWNYSGGGSGNPGTILSLGSVYTGSYIFYNYRYFRYKITLYSDFSSHTTAPVVNTVTINWSP